MDKMRSNIGWGQLRKWFKKEGFSRLRFLNETEVIRTHWLDQEVVFKLKHQEGFETYYKEASGGSLLVFEITIQEDYVVYDAYCPILLFGIWSIKMKFKKKSLLPYPKQGYQVRAKLIKYLKHVKPY